MCVCVYCTGLLEISQKSFKSLREEIVGHCPLVLFALIFSDEALKVSCVTSQIQLSSLPSILLQIEEKHILLNNSKNNK
jgi:hypothetical protein